MKRKTFLFCFVLIFVSTLLFFTAMGRESNPPEEPLTAVSSSEANIEGAKELKVGRPGGTLLMGSSRLPATFNNLLARKPHSSKVTRLIMGNGLVEINPATGKIAPALAKSWRISEDGLKYTFTLRKGLKFSDGKPLTAEDVVFTYRDLIYDSKVETNMKKVLSVGGEFPEIEKKGKYSVQFSLPEKFAPFLYQMSTGIYPKHVFDEVQDSEFKNTWGTRDASRNPEDLVGAGPFKLSSYQPGEKVVLKRNPYYYKIDSSGNQLPYLNRLKIIKIDDSIGKIFHLLGEKIDFYHFQLRETAFLYSRKLPGNLELKVRKDSGGAPLNTDFIAFNRNAKEKELRKYFDDAAFRKAISEAIDRRQIVDEIFQGLAFIQDGPIAAFSPYYNPEAGKAYPTRHRPERAEERLKKVGLVDEDEDGWLETEEGSSFELELLVDKIPRRKKMAEIIARNLEEVGIRIKIKTVGFDKLLRRVFKGDYQTVLLNLLVDPLEPSSHNSIYKSDGVYHFWEETNGENKDPDRGKIDNLLEKATKTADFAERKKLYDKFQQEIARQVPLVYTAGEVYTIAYSKELNNMDILGSRGSVFENIEFIWKSQEEEEPKSFLPPSS